MKEKKEKKIQGHSQTHVGLFSTLPAQFAVFGQSFIELTPYTWLTPSSSPATITRRCQDVPVLSAQALPALDENEARPRILLVCVDVMFAAFIYLKKDECHIHFVLRCRLHPEGPGGGTRRDVSFEEDCLSVRRATHAVRFHAAPQNNVTSPRANRNKNSGFLIIF